MGTRKPRAPSIADYRADLQMHSDWSDGGQTLEEIIETGMSRGYSHSAVTDHSYGLPIAGGLSMERVAAQHAEIDRLNAKYHGRFRLLKGIEANIRADGIRRHDARASSRRWRSSWRRRIRRCDPRPIRRRG